MEVGEGVHLFPYGVYVEDLGAVIIADLHIGFEQVLEESGIHVPVSQFPKMKGQIVEAVRRFRPEKVILAGDVKHEFSKAIVEEWVEVLELIRELKSAVKEVRVVRGNHDNFLIPILKKEGIPLDDPYLLDGGNLILHGHKKALLPEAKRIFIGHVHPAISIRGDLGERVKLRCLLKGRLRNSELYVLPASSPYALGYDLLEGGDSASPILIEADRGKLEVFAVDERAGMAELGRLAELEVLRGKFATTF